MEHFWTTILWVAAIVVAIWYWKSGRLEPKALPKDDGPVIRAMEYLDGERRWFDESELDQLPPDLRREVIEK